MALLGDIRQISVGDLLTYCARMSPQECAAQLEELWKQLGMRFPVAMTLAERVDGVDAAGAAVQGNPVLIGGRDQSPTPALRGVLVDSTGSLLIRPSIDDAGTYRPALADRAGILAVAPPVSKLWTAQNLLSGAGVPTITQAAPGAGLRNVVLAWWYTIACAANAMVAAAGSVAGLVFTAACPVNDMRSVGGNGPIISGANTSVQIQGPTQPALAVGGVAMVGYVAAFP